MIAIFKAIAKFMKLFYTSPCPVCEDGRVSYIGTTESSLDVYECDKCGSNFI